MNFKFYDFGPRGMKTNDTFLLGDSVYDGELFLSLEMTPEQVERKVRAAMDAYDEYVNRPVPREGLIIKKNFAPTRTPLAANLDKVVFPALARGKINLFE